MTKRKVLIPLDGSEFSRQIVRIVRRFFDPEDVALVLFRAALAPAVPAEVMTHDVYAGAGSLSGGYEAYSRAIESSYASIEQERQTYEVELHEELRVEADRLRDIGYTVSAEVHFGDPAQQIVEYAKTADIDLVAMATHGRTGIGRLVLGSVAERVLRGVSVPVLLMRPILTPEEEPTPGEQLAKSLGDGHELKVAVATDGSTHGRKAVALGSDLAEVLDARLALLVTVREQDGAAHGQKVMEDACKLVEHLEPRPTAEPLVGYADEELLQYVAKNRVDLLIVGAFHDRGSGSPMAIGPTAQRLVQHAPASLLMVKGHRPRIRNILVCAAVDDEVAIDVAAQLARATSGKLHLLHVVPPSAAPYLATGDARDIPLEDVLAQGTRLSSVLKVWTSQLESQGFGREAITVRRGNVPEVILKEAHEGRYDLLVVGSQSGPGYFLGSVANSVVRFAEQSVLVVRTSA